MTPKHLNNFKTLNEHLISPPKVIGHIEKPLTYKKLQTLAEKQILGGSILPKPKRDDFLDDDNDGQ